MIDKYFTNTVSRIGGIGLDDIAKEVNFLHSQAFDPLDLGIDLSLDSSGSHKFRSGKEEHLYDPNTIHLLQESTRAVIIKCLKNTVRRSMMSPAR